MKPLASRTSALRQSDIRAVTLAVNRVNGINLGQGICDLPTPDTIKQGAMNAIEGDQSIYTAYNGIKRLRQPILEKVQSFNRIPVSKDSEVMVSVGSTGTFVSTVLTLCEPGDEVILFEPFYGYHIGILRLLGVTPVSVPLSGENWSVDFKSVESAITDKTKAVLVCTPANPTGKMWSGDELNTLLEILQKHDLWAITDEIYEYMTYDGREHISLASLLDAYERTVTLSGFSKTFNMTGWRLGYAVGAEPVLEKMGLVNDLVYICAPAPLQHGVASALPMDATYYEQMLVEYAAKRTLMCETLEDCGFEVNWPNGAYYVFANFERLSKEHAGFSDDREATNTLIETAGVACVPGNSFFANPEDGQYFLRFCYAKEVEVLKEACRKLKQAFA